jgi:cytochrome c
MNALELNKIAGAILLMGLVLMVVNKVGDAFFAKGGHGEAPVATGGGAGPAGGREVAAIAPLEPIGPLLAAGDVAAGQTSFKKCATCHTPDKGGANRVGPNLWNIIGAERGKHAGFAFSQAMAGKGGSWNYDDLNAFLANPKAFVPGTKMAFAGIKSPKERADLIAYLRSLSDSPKPLP